MRLGFRSSAGPFRSFARIAVEPRPYQLVPLLMALKLDPVRLLIADDVGIGKTIEAALIARELLDRGEVQRLAVLCPPHLAEQWQARAARRSSTSTPSWCCPAPRAGWSAACRRRRVALRRATRTSSSRPTSSSPTAGATTSCATCPELVIVDEAHTCAWAGEAAAAATSGTSSLRASPPTRAGT